MTSQAITTIQEVSHEGTYTPIIPDLTELLPEMTEAAFAVKLPVPTNAGDTAFIFTLSDRKWSNSQEPTYLEDKSRDFVQCFRELALAVCIKESGKIPCDTALKACQTKLVTAAKDWLNHCHISNLFGDKVIDNATEQDRVKNQQKISQNIDSTVAAMSDAMIKVLNRRGIGGTGNEKPASGYAK